MVGQNIWETSSKTIAFRELSQPNEPDKDPDIADESESQLLDTSGAEELSVKTLADMFDYRLGEQVHRKHLFSLFCCVLLCNITYKTKGKLLKSFESNHV